MFLSFLQAPFVQRVLGPVQKVRDRLGGASPEVGGAFARTSSLPLFVLSRGFHKRMQGWPSMCTARCLPVG